MATNPKFQAVTFALGRLNHKFEARADELLSRIPEVERRGDNAFDRAHLHLDDKELEFHGVEKFVESLEVVGNGGPLLDDSKKPSAASAVSTAEQPGGGEKTVGSSVDQQDEQESDQTKVDEAPAGLQQGEQKIADVAEPGASWTGKSAVA